MLEISISELRKFRIFEYAVFDFVVSFLGIFLISPILTKIFRKINLEIPLKSWMYFTVPIGILVHVLTGNITPMTKNFLDLDSHYILKFLIFFLVFLGIKNSKRIS